MNDHILTYLQARDFPFVVIGKPYDFIEEITYVDNDNVLAAEQATDYLIQLGHGKREQRFAGIVYGYSEHASFYEGCS